MLPAVEKLFRKSSTANLFTLQGRALGLGLGQVCDPEDAMRQVDRFLLELAQNSRLVVSRVRSSRAFLFPEGFREERKVFSKVGKGIGFGKKLVILSTGEKLEPKLNKAFEVRNKIRIVSIREAIPEGLKVQDDEEKTPLLLSEEKWEAKKIHDLINVSGGDHVIAVREPARNGDFLSFIQAISLFGGLNDAKSKQRNFTLKKGKGRSETKTLVEVRDGNLPRNPKLAWMELENRPIDQGAVCVVPAKYPEKTRREINFQMARRLILSQPLEVASGLMSFDFVVPFEEAKVGMHVMVFKNHRQFYLGTRWSIQEVLPNGDLKLAKVRAKITMSAARFKNLATSLAVVETHKLRVFPGMRLHVEKSFYQGKPKKKMLEQGEIVRVRDFGDDGSLVLDDGREIPAKFRLFSPAFLVRKLHHSKKRHTVVLTQAPENCASKRHWAMGFRSDKLIVFSSKPEIFAGEFECEEGLFHAQKRMQKTLKFLSGEGEFVPSDSRWHQLLALNKCEVPVSQVPDSLRPKELVEVREVPEFLLPPVVKKKKEEEAPKPQQKKVQQDEVRPVPVGQVAKSKKVRPKSKEASTKDKFDHKPE